MAIDDAIRAYYDIPNKYGGWDALKKRVAEGPFDPQVYQDVQTFLEASRMLGLG